MNEELFKEFLKEVKQFLKVDIDNDDEEIATLIIAADCYLINAGCKADYGNFLFELAIKMLVAHWYENREVIGKSDKLAYSLENIITQLIYSYEVN